MTERILMVTKDFPPLLGGIQTYSFEIASRFARHTQWFGVIAPAAEGDREFDRGLPFEVFRVRGGPDPLPLFGTARFTQLARKHKVTLSFHAQWDTVPMALALKRMGLLPGYAVAAHAAEIRRAPFSAIGPAQWAYDRLRRRVLEKADAVIAVSEYTAGLVRQTGAKNANLAVVHNGVDYVRLRAAGTANAVEPDFRASLGIEVDRPLLLTVARLIPRKGIDTVLRALPTVVATVPKLAYCIVGEGCEAAKLKTLVKDLGLTSHVYFAGALGFSALASAYETAQVFVMTPREVGHSVEGFGIVYLEAGAFGLPVIGSRSGGVPDAIVDGETGVLVEPGDADSLARVLVRLFTDPALAARLGAAGKLRVETCASWDHRFAELWRVLRGKHEPDEN